MRLPALHVISVIFGVLLLSRALAVTSEALASEKSLVSELTDETGKLDSPELNSIVKTEGVANAQCLTGEVLDILQADQATLTRKLALVSVREQTLATLEKKLSAQMEQIDAANKTLEERIVLMKTTANADIAHLVEMYKAMKPKQAAEIFNSMDPAFAAGFLREMSGERAGFIMANMDSKKSYAISVIMASNNAKYR